MNYTFCFQSPHLACNHIYNTAAMRVLHPPCGVPFYIHEKHRTQHNTRLTSALGTTEHEAAGCLIPAEADLLLIAG